MFKQALLAASLAVASWGAGATGSILLANPGPLTSFNFDTVSFNGTSGDIVKLTIDLTNTLCGSEACVFGGLNSMDVSGLGGGTASLFGSAGDSVFGFTFTGYNPYETFRFSWDPDTASNSSYGAVVGQFVGAKATADVSFGGSIVKYGDTVAAVGPDVAANLAPVPVPEPSTYALMLAGLAGVGAIARRSGSRNA